MNSYRDDQTEDATMKRKIGKHLAIAREKKGLTQEQLIEVFGDVLGRKSAQSISNWENGRQDPSIITLIKLSDFYGCDLDHLIGRLPEQTHDIQFIHDQTGLTGDAIKKLMSLKGTGIDEIISAILTDKDSDELFSKIKIATDDIEMYWSGISGGDQHSSLSINRDIANFAASHSFVEVINNLRTKFEAKSDLPVMRPIEAIREKERFQTVLKLFEFIDFMHDSDSIEAFGSEENAAREWLKENYSVSKSNKAVTQEEHDEIIRIWHEVDYDELCKMSYLEWKQRFGK